MDLNDREVATIRAALEVWEEELKQGSEWIEESDLFGEHPPLSLAEIKELDARLDNRDSKDARHRLRRIQGSGRWKLTLHVPTYYGIQRSRETEAQHRPEYGTPLVPISVAQADGVRLVLGDRPSRRRVRPDVQIERRPNGWAIFLQPEFGDPVGYVYFLDDGQSFLVVEPTAGSRLQIVSDAPPQLDA
jgi:hypothetical protein